MLIIEHLTKSEENKMLSERQEKILLILKEKHRVSVAFLSKTLFVSEMTVRRDLKVLEASGYIERYNGGAVYKESEICLPLYCRDKLHNKEKKLLAECVKKYLADGMTVYIDSSSTCNYIVPLLSEYKSVKLVTNSVNSLLKAAEHQIKALLIGGEYNPLDMCNVGFKAVDFLQDINMDIGFFSSSGFLTDKGLVTDWDKEQTAVRKAALQNTAKKNFLFTSEKINKSQLYTVCNASEIDGIIML